MSPSELEFYTNLVITLVAALFFIRILNRLQKAKEAKADRQFQLTMERIEAKYRKVPKDETSDS